MTPRASERPTRAETREADQARPRAFLRQIDCGLDGARGAGAAEPVSARGRGVPDPEEWGRAARHP